MTGRIVRTPAAIEDLAEHAIFLEDRAAGVGSRFLDAAETAFVRLAGMPRLGRLRAFRGPRLRRLRSWAIPGFPNHVVFYRPATEGVEILRVLHAARDIDRLLKSDDPS